MPRQKINAKCSKKQMHSRRRSATNTVRSSCAGSWTVDDVKQEQRNAKPKPTIEENEQFSKYLEMCNGKLNRDNAWKISLIDMVTNSMKKNLNFKNLKVAASTLEAMAKLYAMRVDSLHEDILRMAAAGHCDNKKLKRATGSKQHDVQLNTVEVTPKRVKAKKHIVIKNRQTLNRPIDTTPTIDPVFVKLNSSLRSINATDRLMNNVLHTSDSKLLLKWDRPSWCKPCPKQKKDYTMEKLPSQKRNMECTRLFQINFDNYKLRPTLSGNDFLLVSEAPQNFDSYAEPLSPPPLDLQYENSDDSGVAFNSNENTEMDSPLHKDFQLTPEQSQYMRSTDSGIKLEYSYFCMKRDSNITAGPSYWKYATPSPSNNKRARLKNYRRTIKVEDEEWLPYSLCRKRKKNHERECYRKKHKLIAKFETASSMETVSKPNDDEEADLLGIAPLKEHFGDDVYLENEAIQSVIPCPTRAETLQALSSSRDSSFEIAYTFEGAPEPLAINDIPFAKRPKIIDIKALKRSCFKAIDTKLTSSRNKKPIEEQLPMAKDECYAAGIAKLNQVFKDVPKLLTLAMQENVSYAVAFYAILQLANENNYRIFGNSDLKDAIIMRVDHMKPT